MKSRYRKHLERIINRSPIVAFSIENLFENKQTINKDELIKFNKHKGLDREYTSNSYKLIKREMLSDLILFTDNYFLCGGHKYVYLLLPLGKDTFKIVEKESIKEWSKKYWQKEDPENKRDWCYIDEDTIDLYYYIMNSFYKHNKKYCKVQ